MDTLDFLEEEAVETITDKTPKKDVKPRPYLKGGYFLIGDSPADEMFTVDQWTEEQLMIRDMTRDFFVAEVQEPFKKRGRELEIKNEADKKEILGIFQRAAEQGMCGVSIPEKYGGMGLDFNTTMLFSEALAGGYSFATTIGAQTSIGSLPILFYGNEAQKQKYLPGIASGESIAAYALTEPSAGSDANSGKSKAVLSEDGKHYILNGQKIWITNGGIADVFVVFAKIDDDKTLSAFIIERDFKGVSTGAEEKKMGLKGSSTVQLFFDNTPVPVENLLYKRGEGFKIALNILNTGRIKIAAGGAGAGKAALSIATPYAVERKQFGQSIAEFGAIKHKLSELAILTYVIETATYRTGYNVDLKLAEFQAADPNDEEAELKAMREFAVECSILKVKGSYLACASMDEAMQIHGGMGYAVETGLEMGYRDARITKIYEGTNDINRMLTVGELMKRAFQTKEVNLAAAGKKIPGFLFKQLLPFKSHSGLKAEKRLVQGIKNAFLLVSGAAGRKLKKKLIDEQEIILNLSDILAEAYFTESVLMRIEKLGKTNKEKAAIEQKIMEVYLYEALSIVRKAATEAIDSFATGTERRMLHFMVRQFLPAYRINPKANRRLIADHVIAHKGYGF